MDLLFDTTDAVERRQQGSWLHELHAEVKRLQVLAEEVNHHYAATLTTLKSIAHAYSNINGLLVSVSRHFTEVSAGSRIGVGTNVAKFKNLVTTMGDSPQGKEVQRLLKDQIRDAEELKALVKGSFGALKQRDQQYATLAAARPTEVHRNRQLHTEAKLGKEVRAVYAKASSVLDKECIGFVRAWTGGASAVIQLVRDRYTRGLLAATDVVGTSHGYPATGVVQHPSLAQETHPVSIRPVGIHLSDGLYGENGNDYVSETNSEVLVAMQPPSPMLLGGRQRADAGVALQFVE